LVPPHAGGAPVLLLVTALAHPPLALVVASHAVNWASTADCVWQDATVVLLGQTNDTAGGAVTVKLALQVVVVGVQLLVYVKVTVTLPPQAFGAEPALLVRIPLHPPLELAVASHAVNSALTAAWVWQDATVVLLGQTNDTVGAAVTVKLALQVVVVGAQLLVYVKVTVVVPPQAEGAPVLLLLLAPLHPPLELAVASHAVNCALTAVWVWQDATVVLAGHTRDTVGAAVTVKLALAVEFAAQELVAVHVTVTDPPQADGAPVLLLVTDKLHPPLLTTAANQFVYAVLICVCVWQLVIVVFAGAVNNTGGAVFVYVWLQELEQLAAFVTVNATV
jgi:hypothetical protein